MLIFEVGSALCGAAPSLDALIGGRAICGIGGMGIYLGTMNMVSALTDERERPMYLGFVGLTWGIGTAYVSTLLSTFIFYFLLIFATGWVLSLVVPLLTVQPLGGGRSI